MNLPFVEKYRPSILDDIILPEKYYSSFKKMIENKDLSGHLLFYGKPGTGKTTSALCLIKSIGAEYIFINCSEERGIDVVRNKIKQFSSLINYDDKCRVILCDEVDNATIDYFLSLRPILEQYIKNVKFIMTCNYIQKIPEPIISRFQCFEFLPLTKDVVLNHLKENILKKENITFNDEDLNLLYTVTKGDLRRIINTLQKSVIDGKLIVKEQNIYDEFMNVLQSKNIEKLKTFLIESNIDYNDLYGFLFSKMTNANKIIILAEYMYRNNLVADPLINFTACICKMWGLV